MSVNEGLNAKDLDPNVEGRMQPLLQTVRRSLEEELIGANPEGRALLDKIRNCCVTGAILYLPNMSLNLCIDVAIDCSAADIRRVYPHARDSTFEASIINESRWDSATGLPEHSAPGIHRLITSTVGTRPRATWDEGALVTVMLASLASTH